MIYENNIDSDFPHQMVFDIENEKAFFKLIEPKFSMQVSVEIDTQNKEVFVDKDKFEYSFSMKTDIDSWLHKNVSENMYMIDNASNCGKIVKVMFKDVSDLILFKLSCL